MEVGLEGKSLLSRRTFSKNYFIHVESTEHYAFRSDPAT